MTHWIGYNVNKGYGRCDIPRTIGYCVITSDEMIRRRDAYGEIGAHRHRRPHRALHRPASPSTARAIDRIFERSELNERVRCEPPRDPPLAQPLASRDRRLFPCRADNRTHRCARNAARESHACLVRSLHCMLTLRPDWFLPCAHLSCSHSVTTFLPLAPHFDLDVRQLFTSTHIGILRTKFALMQITVAPVAWTS